MLAMMAAGMGNWDEFVRTGGWDVDARLPMALEVEAADRVMAAGRAVSGGVLASTLSASALRYARGGCPLTAGRPAPCRCRGERRYPGQRHSDVGRSQRPGSVRK
jgi:hypothetical protein